MRCCMASCGRRFVIAAGLAMLVGGLLGERGPGAQATLQRAGAVAGPTANSQTFVDPTGDNLGGAPDITTVRVSNDNAGNLEFQLLIPNRTDLGDHDFISVYLDTDQSASTGCNLGGGFGVDWALAALGRTAPVEDRFSLHRIVPVCQLEPPGTTPRARTQERSTAPLRPSLCASARRTSATLRAFASKCSQQSIRSVPRHPTRPETSRPGSTRYSWPAQYRLPTGLPHV